MRLIDFIIDALYPKRCASCKEITGDGGALCGDCADKLERVRTPICVACGNTVKECECDTFIYHFDGVVAPFKNKGVAQDMVYSYKFTKDFSCVDFIVENMTKALKESYADINFDCITFVPKKRREFNQCKPLAKGISKSLNIPVRADALIKIKDNQVQHKLSLIERFGNVQNVYRGGERLNRQTVLLIDDIKTTGATLNECAKELKFSGAQKVYCVTALIR